jgi:mycofactocin precursor
LEPWGQGEDLQAPLDPAKDRDPSGFFGVRVRLWGLLRGRVGGGKFVFDQGEWDMAEERINVEVVVEDEAETVVSADLLVEEVSIDGMCGVY